MFNRLMKWGFSLVRRFTSRKPYNRFEEIAFRALRDMAEQMGQGGTTAA